jgi:hypothetical protein
MSDDAGDERIWIESTMDSTTGRPMCFVRWGTKTKLVETERVIATARELFGAAAAAEADVALVEFLREADLPDQVVGTALMHAREQRAKSRMPDGPKPVFRIGAIAGARTGLPLVSIGLGSREDTLDVESARDLASDWYETAIASILDVRIRYTLGDHGFDIVAVEEFMSALSLLNREGGLDEPR